MNKVDVKIFEFDGIAVRAEVRDGKPWFIAADICSALGIENPRDAVAKVCNPKGVASIYTLTAGGRQKVKVIDEGNLYRLIFKSRKPSAERFTSWVCDDVLPAIRETGEYQAQWKKQRHEACASYKVMSEVTRVARELIGKVTAPYHYANEARLVNLCLAGEWKSLDRNALDIDDLDILAKLENRNSVLIARGVPYETRKELLKQHAIDLRHPKLHMMEAA